MSGEERNAKRDHLLSLGLELDLVNEWLDERKRQAWIDKGIERLEDRLRAEVEMDKFDV